MRFLLLLIVGILSQNLTAAPLSCSSVTTKGRLFPFQDPRVQKQEKRLFLGEGVWGKVYLLEDNKVEKIYKSSAQAMHDFRALSYLKVKLQNSKLRLITANVLSDTQLGLNYIPGRTVEDLHSDTTLPAEFRQLLREKYISLLRELITFFEDEGFLVDVKKAELPRVSAQEDSFSAGPLHFILRADNMIVDPETLEITLIDPA